MASYSLTPLFKKLGIKDDCKIIVLHSPQSYLLFFDNEMPKVTYFTSEAAVDMVHLFCSSMDIFTNDILFCKEAIKQNGMIWVSWPKKSSGIITDINEDMIRNKAIETYLKIRFNLGFLKIKKHTILITNQLNGYKNQITIFDKTKNINLFFQRKY